jgi:hypothetical protein
MNGMNHLSYYAGASVLKLGDELRSARLNSPRRSVLSARERVLELRSGELFREAGDDPRFVPYRRQCTRP